MHIIKFTHITEAAVIRLVCLSRNNSRSCMSIQCPAWKFCTYFIRQEKPYGNLSFCLFEAIHLKHFHKVCMKFPKTINPLDLVDIEENFEIHWNGRNYLTVHYPLITPEDVCMAKNIDYRPPLIQPRKLIII